MSRMWTGAGATASAWGSAGIPSGGSPWIRRGVTVLLGGAALAAAASVGAALLAIGAWHHLYFGRRNLADLEAFTRFEFPTIGHVYDTNGQPLIELARESRQITQYANIPPIVRDAILATEDKHFLPQRRGLPQHSARARQDPGWRPREAACHPRTPRQHEWPGDLPARRIHDHATARAG
jgi:hypothetical protein